MRKACDNNVAPVGGRDCSENLSIIFNMVIVAQLVEHLIVVQAVAGSSPVFHPKTSEGGGTTF